MNRYRLALLAAVLLMVTSSVIVRVSGAGNSASRRPRAPLPPLAVGEYYAVTVEQPGDVRITYFGRILADEKERLLIEKPLQHTQKTFVSMSVFKNSSLAVEQHKSNVSVYKPNVAFVGPAPARSPARSTRSAQ